MAIMSHSHSPTKPFSTLPTIPAPLIPPVPFEIQVPNHELQELRTLVRVGRVPAETYETKREDGRYGVGRGWMLGARERWGEFDWRKTEDKINSFPNFKSKVKIQLAAGGKEEVFEVHFVGLFSEKADAIPLLLLHGWPGSFLEFLPILELLRKKYTPQTLPYHVIVSSMPGYGFSSPPPLDRELIVTDIPNLLNQLMLDLGFATGYIAQGGDLGAGIARVLAVKHSACKAMHTNYANWTGVPPPALHPISSLSAIEQAGLEKGKTFVATGIGYSIEAKTKPGTLGLVLGSSPLALLAWIGEKFLSWSGKGSEVGLDEILEGVMLYWFCESGGRGLYPYRFSSPNGGNMMGDSEYYVEKPMGYSYFPHELAPVPVAWVGTTGRMVFSRSHDKGGHFAALEVPELLLGDIEEFVKIAWAENTTGSKQ